MSVYLSFRVTLFVFLHGYACICEHPRGAYKRRLGMNLVMDNHFRRDSIEVLERLTGAACVRNNPSDFAARWRDSRLFRGGFRRRGADDKFKIRGDCHSKVSVSTGYNGAPLFASEKFLMSLSYRQLIIQSRTPTPPQSINSASFTSTFQRITLDF